MIELGMPAIMLITMLCLQATVSDLSLAAESKADAQQNAEGNNGATRDGQQTAAPDQESDQTSSQKPAPLTGSVSRSDFGHQVQQQQSGTLDSDRDEKPKFHIFSGKHKYRLTSEDYRNLQFGVTGFQSTKLLGKYQVVTHVFHHCPAEAAGILPGDKVLKANDHVFSEHDAQPEVWKYMDGRAGTPVEITILRKKELMTFRLTRMNIEDIQDGRLRWMYEHLVHTLGTPGF